jgi:hypothetical protein
MTDQAIRYTARDGFETVYIANLPSDEDYKLVVKYTAKENSLVYIVRQNDRGAALVQVVLHHAHQPVIYCSTAADWLDLFHRHVVPALSVPWWEVNKDAQ